MTTPLESPLPPQMPGYKALPSFMVGAAADQVREAEARHRTGDSAAAVQLLEEALEASIAFGPTYPGWLCGRLAALYRTLGRYDDEVRLLERYRDSQTSEEARTRYDARLCKARTIAERKRRPSSGAIDSVRASLGRPRPRRARRHDAAAARPARPAVSLAAETALAEALHAGDEQHAALLREALVSLVAEGRRIDAPAALLVSALKRATAVPNGVAPDELSSRYGAALMQLLALYFEEDAE
jgi:hypothetical protein